MYSMCICIIIECLFVYSIYFNYKEENSNMQISIHQLFNKRACSFYRSHLTTRLSFTNVHTILIDDEAVQERVRNFKNLGCPRR